MRIPVGAHLERHSLPPLILPAEEPETASMAFPGASGTVLAAVPQTWPAPGPTYDSFLYSQIQASAQPGTANTWTAVQTFSNTGTTGVAAPISLLLTDTGGGSDSDLLRPEVLTLEHDTTAATIAGVGAAIGIYTKDASGNRVLIGRELAEITGVTAGAVNSTLTWSVMKSGTFVEGLRLVGAQGPVAAVDPAGSTAGGNVNARLIMRGDMYVLGTDAVANAPLRLATFEHQLSVGTVAAGFGSEHFWQAADATGTKVGVARDQVLVTTATAGAVDSTRAFAIRMQGVEVETFRIQALGAAPAALGGITGFTGGRMLVQGEFRHSGTGLAFYGATVVTKPSVTGSRASGAALTSLLTQLASLGLLTDSTSS